MTWWQVVPELLVALAVTMIPGLVVLAAAGVRRFNLLALAAPVSMSLVGIVGVLAPFVGLPFGPAVYAGFALVVVAVIVGVRFLFHRVAARRATGWFGWLAADLDRGSLASNDRMPSGGVGRLRSVAVALGFVIGATFISGRLISGIGSPTNFSQTFDNIFHLNAVHHITVTQNASSFTLGNLTEASAGFYPAAMHGMFALVEQLTGSATPIVVNVCVLVLAAVVWPLGCIFLITRFVGYRPIPMFLAGALSAGLSGSPYLLIGFGVLYPLFAALVIQPVVLGLIAETLRVSAQRATSWAAPVIALVAVLPGLALTHPSALVASMAFTVPMLLVRLWMAWRDSKDPAKRFERVFWSLAVPAYLVVLFIVWRVVRPDLSAAPWAATQTTSGAIGEVAGASPLGAITAWVYLFGTILGLYVIARWQRSQWWVAAIYVIAGVLYVFAAGWASGTLRTFIVGVWYNDPFRLAALLPVATLPVVVIGYERVLAGLRQRIDRWIGARTSPAISRTSGLVALSVVMLLGLGLGLATQSGALSNIQNRIEAVFKLDDQSDLVDTDELALLQQVPDLVPEDGAIVVNPLAGGGLAYSLVDRRVIPPHVFGDRSPDEELLLQHWDEAAFRADVCPAIERENAYWALDFGTKTVISSDERFRGVDGIVDGTAPEVEELAREGDARLVRITACD